MACHALQGAAVPGTLAYPADLHKMHLVIGVAVVGPAVIRRSSIANCWSAFVYAFRGHAVSRSVSSAGFQLDWVMWKRKHLAFPCCAIGSICCPQALGHVGRVIATTFESLEILRERYSEIDETIGELEKHFAEVHHASSLHSRVNE